MRDDSKILLKRNYASSNLLCPKTFTPSLLAIYFIAFCAFTEFPALSSGGAKAAMPISPGTTPIMPPPTPVLAGTPDV